MDARPDELDAMTDSATPVIAPPSGEAQTVQPEKVAVIEVLDRDGHARRVVPAWRWPITIGRAIDCDVILDDVHAAARHATLNDRDGVLTLAAGETVNGVQLTRRRLAASQSAELSPGEIFQVGATRLRIRRASDAIVPERPLTKEVPTRVGRVPIVVLLLALAAWSVAQQWVGTDPGTRVTEYLPVLLTLPVLLALWSGFWSVGSRLVQHRFDFWKHAHIAVRYTLLVSLLDFVLPLAAFSLGWTFLSRISGVAEASAMWAMVLAHLTLIQPTRRRILSMVMASLLVGGVSLFLIRNYQVHERVFPELYVTRLGPPALRVAPAVETNRFIDEARDLKSVLESHLKDEPGSSSSSLSASDDY